MATAELQPKLVLEATRGAVIAVHAATGLARGNVQALRLLRAAEGLCRTAVAVLQAGSGAQKTGQSERGSSKDKDKDKGKDKGKGKDMDVDPAKHLPPRSRRRRPRRKQALRAAAPEFVPPADLDDEWADQIGPRYPVGPARFLAPAAPPPEAGQPAEPPGAARTSSRSPRRSSGLAPGAAVASAGPAPASPRAGRIATLHGLVSRPDLDQAYVLLHEVDPKTGRWICRTKGGEQLRISPNKLVVIPEDHQRFMKLRFEAALASAMIESAPA